MQYIRMKSNCSDSKTAAGVQVWKLEPSVEPMSWEPDEIRWLSSLTLLLKKKMWTGKNPAATFTYAKLTIQ